MSARPVRHGRAVAAYGGCVAAGAAMALVFGGGTGAVAGLGTVALLAWAVHRWEPERRRQELRRAAADLPVAADLLAAALRAGTPTERAAHVVGEALGGGVGARLMACAEELRVGNPPARAWRQLGELPGADRLVRAAVRSAESGAALSSAFTVVAEDLRAAGAARAEARARRVGVLAVLPLGLCFLPAFVLAGVVPVVVAVLGDVLAAR